ncbi:MAG: carbohydrate ABC transporter permease [Actinomycetota bacterium]|nr:carbohydrate ABC transporter permease [Actinomycetota bacterium]
MTIGSQSVDVAGASRVRRGERPPLFARIAKMTPMTFLTVVALVYLFIMVTFVLASMRSEQSLLRSGAFGPLSISRLQFDWRQLEGFSSGIYFHWLENSAIVAFAGAAIAVAVALPAGYALAMLHFRGRRVLLFLTILTMVMPNTVLVIPLFLEVSAVHQIDKLLPVAVIFGFFPFGTYLAFVHYKTTLPFELLESGRIDGVSEIGLFMRLAVPLAKQAVALVFFFAFVADWTNYFLPLVMLPSSAVQTVSVGLQELITSSQLFNPSAAAGLNVQLYMPELAFAAVLQMLPVLVVFVVAQRYLTRGAMLGAVKG